MKPKRDLENVDLISHLVDGEAAAADWDELLQRADANAELLRELAETQRDHAALGALTRGAAAIADGVGVKEGAPMTANGPRAVTAGATERTHILGRIGQWGGWAGWAVAATILIVWSAAMRDPAPMNVQEAALPVLSASDAFQAYLDRGREEGIVVREMPTKVLLDARPLPDSDGYELLYLHQVLEKTRVPSLYEFTGPDEQGRPTMVRYDNVDQDPM